MAASADVVTAKVQAYLNLPVTQRCKEITSLIDESSTTELQHVFRILVDSLFGIVDNVGWGLHNISQKRNPQEYEALCLFLSPQGPLFNLCYKLLPDCYLKYEFPVSYLPMKIRQNLEEGIIPPFYLDKIRDENSIRPPSALYMNPFEYYIFHYAYHLTNPWLQLPQQENVWVNWETVYVQLAHTYLYHFLPRDNSSVLPIIGPYVKKTPQRKLMQSPDSKKMHTPRLLKASILSQTTSSTSSSVSPQQCLPQVWRSETIVQVFLDFWLEYTEQPTLQLNSSYSQTMAPRHSIFSGEHIRLVRAFIKTLHEFANSTVGDGSAMDELKRIILPSVQGKIYIFLRNAIHHWPLDSSFRLILEAWLSFIQPWRYVPTLEYSNQVRFEEEEKGKIHNETVWIPFVANNLLAYSVIFQQLLPRFMRTDLVAPKNALMLYRVTKVFSQPHLARMIADIERCIDDVGLNKVHMSTNQWTSIVRQQMLELEGPSSHYIPMFSVSIVSQVVSFLSIINQSYLTATSLIEALEKRKSARHFLISVWEFFNGEENSLDDISIEERRRVPIFLANAQQQLIDIFQLCTEDIPQSAIVADQEYHESILSTSSYHQSEVDSILDTSRPGVSVRKQDGRQGYRYIQYLGDPELIPIQSNECAMLVRYFYKLASYLNETYQPELNAIYNRRNFVGSIIRQILIPPTTIIQLPKRTQHGFRQKEEKYLPPRLSLRPFANYYFLTSMFIGILLAWLINYGAFKFLIVIFSLWFLYILARAVLEPWLPADSTQKRHSS